jgi:hypothetical protein
MDLRRICSIGALALLALAACQERNYLVIAAHGRARYRIVVPDNANPSLRYAATELQRTLSEISGATLEIVAEKEAGSSPAILLGACRRIEKAGLAERARTLTGDGVLIKTVGRDIMLLGDGDRGVLNSVYVLLERFLDCRFLAHDCTVVPKKSVLVLPRIDYSYSPPFIYREVLAYDAHRWDFACRQKLNGGNMELVLSLPGEAPARLIPGVVIYPFVHTFAAIAPPDELFGSHPEFFGLVKGRRHAGIIGGQLCLTNPDVLRMAKEKALAWIARRPDLTTVDISQNDAYPGSSGACECERCAAIVKEEGSQHGPILRLVNEVADAVKERYPGKFVDTLAYDYTIIPPAVTKPRDNVIIRLCHYGCYFHGIETEDMSRDFRGAVDRWPRLAKHVWVWHYGTNFWHYLAPNPNLEGLVKDLRYYAAHGIDGLMLQADIQSPGGELAELRQYLAAQLMWDPAQDARKPRSDFCSGYYGPAAGEALEYLDLMDRLKDTNGKHYPTNGWDPPEVATPEFVASGLAVLDRGLAKAGDQPYRGRVEKLLLSLWYMQLGWPDRYGLSPEEGRELLAKFTAVVGDYHITNESEGPVGNMDRFLADRAAKLAARSTGSNVAAPSAVR